MSCLRVSGVSLRVSSVEITNSHVEILYVVDRGGTMRGSVAPAKERTLKMKSVQNQVHMS